MLDFEVTANRPDALSVIGFAREVGTAYSLPVKPLVPKPLPSKPTSAVAVKLEAPDLCPRYAAAVADVTIAPSPAWLASRLQAAGVRPINNVVDVTNYVLLELGQPMHAFDLEKLAGSEIRDPARGARRAHHDARRRRSRARPGDAGHRRRRQGAGGRRRDGRRSFGSERDDEDHRARERVFRSQKRSPDEQEARAQDGSLGAVRTGRRRQRGGQRPRAGDDAPRGDWRGTRARRRHRRISRAGDAPEDRAAPGAHQADARPGHSRCRRRTHPQRTRVSGPQGRARVGCRGADLSRRRAARGRPHRRSRAALRLRPVALDLSCARRAARAVRSRPSSAIDSCGRVLLAAGCSEALTFSFIDAAAAAPFADARTIVPIENPLSAQFSVLRPSLLPGLLASVAHNRHRERTDVRLFELGASMTRAGESRHVAVALTGNGASAHWSAGHRTVDFFDAKGIVEAIAGALHVDVTFDGAAAPSYLVRGRAATISSAGARLAASACWRPRSSRRRDCRRTKTCTSPSSTSTPSRRRDRRRR